MDHNYLRFKDLQFQVEVKLSSVLPYNVTEAVTVSHFL